MHNDTHKRLTETPVQGREHARLGVGEGSSRGVCSGSTPTLSPPARGPAPAN